jgi:hypothetical protein
MKSIAIIGIVFLSYSLANAQTWDEWFRQKKTQKKYLVQQVAALKLYLKYLKKGYNIVETGLTMVGDIKEGNYNADKDYFTSLVKIKGIVANAPEVSSILLLQSKIALQMQGLKKRSMSSDWLTPDEKRYILEVQDNMYKESNAGIDELKDITSENILQMKDDERMERIKELHEDFKEKYAFVTAFANSTDLLIMQRQREKFESTKVNILYP